ncbi:MAG: hypothetical protein V1489_02935 [Candidatus Liptonbacteria bacterium]
MIVVRAPLRISFVGGGTDMADFYTRTPGRTIAATIDKFVYVVINRTPLIDKVSARYSIVETADHPSELKHTRIKAALLDMGIHKNIEIATFGTLPAKTGFGSSASFSVDLMKGLHAFQEKKLGQCEAAEAASRLDNELVGEKRGKQDYYAASFGGFNVMEFKLDHSVNIDPVLLDYKNLAALENHLLVFFVGIHHKDSAGSESVLGEDKKFEMLKTLADAVYEFRDRLLANDFRGLGAMLHDLRLKEKQLNHEEGVIDELYSTGMGSGAWGGKFLNQGGGCILFLASPERHEAIRSAMREIAAKNNLQEFREIPVRFVQSGAEVLFNGDYHHSNAF